MQLRIPGPTPCPEAVLQALSRQMINHRGKEFGDIISRITGQLKELFQTKEDLFILTGSGTGGMEAAIVNTLSPGDGVLAISIGVFGERFADIAERFGARVTRLTFPYGKPASPEAVRAALQQNPEVKAVLVTHNETSTGVTNDLAALSAMVNAFDKLLIVDAISSLGSIPLPVDAWRCPVVITGSQKGWMVPPGLAMVSFSQKAWEAHQKATMPRFYWDFTRARNYLQRGQTPWTPAISIFYGLEVALGMMLKEGLDNIIARHVRVGRKAREGVKELGLELFAEESHASNTVTAVKVPPGVDGKKLGEAMRNEGIILSGGQGKMEGQIFRIGHLGWVQEEDIGIVLQALRRVLPRVGLPVQAKTGV